MLTFSYTPAHISLVQYKYSTIIKIEWSLHTFDELFNVIQSIPKVFYIKIGLNTQAHRLVDIEN